MPQTEVKKEEEVVGDELEDKMAKIKAKLSLRRAGRDVGPTTVETPIVIGTPSQSEGKYIIINIIMFTYNILIFGGYLPTYFRSYNT